MSGRLLRNTPCLLPRSWRWASAVVEATWDDHRYTQGGSVDDASVGDLDSRIVMIINPENWGAPEVISQFFSENYPGARLRTIEAKSSGELIARLRAM